MTAPQNPAPMPGPADFQARRDPGGRRRAEPMRGSLSDAGPGGPPPRAAQRFDLRAELGALAAEPHPFAFWQRLEQLPERFEREHNSAPPPAAPSRPASGGLPSLSGDLGGETGRSAAGLSGSLAPASEQRPEFTGGLSGSLIPPQPDSSPLAPNPQEQAEESRPSLRGDLPQAPPAPDEPAPQPVQHAAPTSGPLPQQQPAPDRTPSIPPAPAPAGQAGPPPEPPRPQQPAPPPPQAGPPAPQGPPPPPPAPQPSGPPAGRPPGPPPVPPPPPQGRPPAPPQPHGTGPQAPPPQAHQPPPPQRAEQQRPAPQAAEQDKPAKPAPRPKPVERADGGFGPIGSTGTWSSGSGKTGYGRTPSWSAEDFKEDRGEGDDLRVGAGYKPGETGSGAVPQFLIEADELFDDEDGRLVAPPVLGEAPSSFRDF